MATSLSVRPRPSLSVHLVVFFSLFSRSRVVTPPLPPAAPNAPHLIHSYTSPYGRSDPFNLLPNKVDHSFPPKLKMKYDFLFGCYLWRRTMMTAIVAERKATTTIGHTVVNLFTSHPFTSFSPPRLSPHKDTHKKKEFLYGYCCPVFLLQFLFLLLLHCRFTSLHFVWLHVSVCVSKRIKYNNVKFVIS